MRTLGLVLLTAALLLGNGCATALVNEWSRQESVHEAELFKAYASASSDGAQEVMLGVDVTRLGQIKNKPVRHLLAAIFDALAGYFAYDELQDNGDDEPERLPGIEATNGSTVEIRDAEGVPEYIRADNSTIVVDRYAGEQ